MGLAEAARIFRLTFSTFNRLADPLELRLDTEYVATRWRAYERLRAAGSKTQLLGTSMESHRAASYNREDVCVIDDWR